MAYDPIPQEQEGNIGYATAIDVEGKVSTVYLHTSGEGGDTVPDAPDDDNGPRQPGDTEVSTTIEHK